MASAAPGVPQTLVDVQLTAITAKATVNTVSGQANDGTQMTAGSVGSTQPTTGWVWHIRAIEVFPGTLAPGAAEPDLWAWVRVDSQDYSAWFYIDCSISGCMLPRRTNAVGRKIVLLGDSMIQAAKRNQQGGGLPRNMPGRFTGFKIADNIDIYFYSVAGFTAANMVEPVTVQLKGEAYDSGALGYLSQWLPWNGAISETSARRAVRGMPAYTAQHGFAGPYTADGWSALSDGAGQGNLKVMRTFGVALPQVNVTGAQDFVLSARATSVGGKAGNVLTNQDLGWAYSKGRNAVKIIEFGRRPDPNAGYFGIATGNNTYIPQPTPQGEVSTQGNPRVPFGQVQPTRADSNLWYSMDFWGGWGGDPEPEVVAGEDAAFAIGATSGDTIIGGAAATDKTAYGGVSYFTGNPATGNPAGN